MKLAKRGLVLGKFMPLHSGHLYLIKMALAMVDELTIVIDIPQADAEIPQATRYAWLQEVVPQARILCLKDENPQTPELTEKFWSIWRKSLTKLLNEQTPDLVFASEHYGVRLAKELDVDFIPVDINRTAVPICATDILRMPSHYWEFLPSPVRAFYCQRISVFGPESTGKTNLARRLSKEFSATYVSEYARAFLEQQQGKIHKGDLVRIAYAQAASEDALAGNSNGLLICDTDPLATLIWNEVLGSAEDANCIYQCTISRRYDLTLLCDIDVPWVNDSVRYCPENRKLFFDRCQQVLEQNNRPYIVLSGSWDERWEMAMDYVGSLRSGVSLP